MNVIGKLETVDPFVLERHEIAQVICQIRFSPVLRLREEDAVIPFQEAIRSRYPDFRAEQVESVILTPQGVARQQGTERIWRFASHEDGYDISLTTDFVALQTTKYVDIGDLCKRLKSALGLVAEHYSPAKTMRIGLRFINEIRFEASELPEAMLKALNPLFLGVGGAPEFASAVVRNREIVQFEADNTRFAVRHGLHPMGVTTVEALGETTLDQRPFYLLDLDAYEEMEVDFAIDVVDERVKDFNDLIRSFFAWAVNEEFRKKALGQREEP